MEKICFSLVFSSKPLLIIIWTTTGIPLCLHFHGQFICLKPTWISRPLHQLLTLHSTSESRTSFSSCLCCWSYQNRNTNAILYKYRDVYQQMHLESSLQWLHLQAEHHFWGFSRRCQGKHILLFYNLEYIVD